MAFLDTPCLVTNTHSAKFISIIQNVPFSAFFHYSPYGEVTFLNADFSVKSTQTSSTGNTHLYTGRERDPETGLQLNRNRFYHVQMGRWVNRDPLEYDARLMNLYNYVYSNPLVYTDPSGKITALGGCAVGGIASGGTSFVISWWNGDDLGTCACKGACAGLGGCIQGAIVAQFPSTLGGCLGGALSNIAEQACLAGCGERPPLNTCDAGNFVVSTLLGCIGGGAAEADDKKIELILTLVGIDYAIWSSMCK